MAISYNSLTSAKTRYVVTLTSGTSWTIPTGVTQIIATLIGAGGGGAGSTAPATLSAIQLPGLSGACIISTISGLTPGNTITYAIGAGGSAGGLNAAGGLGGTTTMTGATSAPGGPGALPFNGSGVGQTNNATVQGVSNGGGSAIVVSGGTASVGGAGGAGAIVIEYWV